MCNVVISPVFFAGYYCNGSTILSNPPDGSTGGGCPLGHYCPTGTSVPNACQMGYYLDMILSSVASACKICKLGEYQRILSLFLKNLSCFILNVHGDKWCGLRLNNWLCRFRSCGPLLRELDKPFYDLWWNYELMVKDKQQTLWINYVLPVRYVLWEWGTGWCDRTLWPWVLLPRRSGLRHPCQLQLSTRVLLCGRKVCPRILSLRIIPGKG